MSRWPEARLDDLVEVEREIVLPGDIADGTTYVGLENIQSGGSFVGVAAVSSGDLASGKFNFSRRHLLYGKLRPYLAKIARPTFDGICSTDILPLLPGERVDRDYLAHILRAPEMVGLANSLAGGANLPRIAPSALLGLSVPTPPLPEQRRIAAILDKADELRAKRRQALALLDELTQSIFLEMFGDPARNPKGWGTACFADVARKIGSGATPTGGREAYGESGIALIRSMNVHDHRFVWDGLARINDEQAAELDGVTIADGDVLLNITGASVARVCRVPSAVLPARVNQHVMILRPTDKLLPRFLEWVLLAPGMKRHLLNLAEGGATRQAISKAQIEQLRVIVPPLEVQEQFDVRAASAEALVVLQIKGLEECDDLFASLQHRAFRGEL